MVNKAEKVFKALGEKNRLRILNMLSAKPLCVCEITEIIKLSQSTVSGHLKILKDAEIIEDIKDGLWVEYRLVKSAQLNRDLFKMLKTMIGDDKVLEKEKQAALIADRNKICGK